MADLLPLNAYGYIDGGPTDPTTLPEVTNRINTNGRPGYIPLQARPGYYNYKNGLRIPFDKIPSTTEVIPTSEPYSRTAVPVKEPYGPNYPARYKGRPNLPSGPVRTYPVIETPKTYPAIESSRYLPTSVPSKFGWLKAGGKLLGGPVGAFLTGYQIGDAANNYFGLSDKLIGNAGKGDLSELTRSAEVIKTPGQGSTYNGEISDAEFNSMSHQEKLNWLADRNQYRRDLAANYVSASPTATNEYGEGKTPTGNVVLGSEAPTDAMLPDGTMVHDGVTVAPTVPTVDTLIATANKPRVANRVANRTPVASTTPTPTFNYGGSAPSYASSYNLNRDPNYQYSEAYAWRNNPAPTPNGWAKPNPRASSITNYYAGIGY
jgi:hypothetical protein